MKYLILASLLAAIAHGGSLHRTGSSISPGYAYKKDGYDKDSYQKENYAKDDGGSYENKGYKEPKCYPVYETMYKDQCENYHEKVCYSVQEEQCSDVMGKKCQAIKTSKQERKCHYVNELLCSLKQTVQYEEVPAVFTVQKCHTAIERVCDTIYDTVLTEKDDFQCIEVVNPYCTVKEHIVYDKTCRTVVHFDCKHDDYSNHVGYGEPYKSKEYSGDDKSGYEGSEEYGKYPSHYCKKTYETKCYSTPRTVSMEYCLDRKEKVCEKLTEKVPIPSEKQNCHDEKKKVCELEQRSQPKQVKKYVYTKHCRPVPKTVCDNADQMYLTPSCVPTSWKKCSYYPKEKCENVPKKHCYQVPYQIEKMHCPKGYSADYVKPHAYKDDQYQHDTYKHDTHNPSMYNRMKPHMGQQGHSLDLPERESQLFLKLKLKTILTSKVLELISPMEPTDPMMPVDPMEPVEPTMSDLINPADLIEIVDSVKPENTLDLEDPMVSIDLVEREAQNNLQVLKLKSILKAKLAKIVDPMKLDDLLGLVDSLKFGQAEEDIGEMDLADNMEPADVMSLADLMAPVDEMQVL